MDHGSLTAQMGNHLKNAGIKPNTVYVAGFSLSPATAAAIENGYVQLVSEAQPYVMGYFGVVQTVLSKKYGFTGFSIDTGGGIVDATNIGAVSAFAKQGLPVEETPPKGRRELLKKDPLFFFPDRQVSAFLLLKE